MQRSLLVAVLCLVAGIAQGASFVVSSLGDAGPNTLRDAVTQANTSPGADTITFTVTGTITLTSGSIVLGDALTIQGPGAASLTIDGNSASRIFVVNDVVSAACPALTGPADFPVTISGLRLVNGLRNVVNSSGGAIIALKSLTLADMVFEGNEAKNGGALGWLAQYSNQSLTITNSQFLDNRALELTAGNTGAYSGGAVLLSENCPGTRTTTAAVAISNSLFSGNSVEPAQLEGRGGAIANYGFGTLTITESRFVDNAVNTPSPRVSTFSYPGGALHLGGRALTLQRVEVSENSADYGGGMSLFRDAADLQGAPDVMQVLIVNSTIAGNVANLSGGGVNLFGNVAASLVNTTVAGNASDINRTGGVRFASSAGLAFPKLELASSILGQSLNGGVDCGSNPVSNIFANNSIVQAGVPGQCVLIGAGNQTGIDPLLGPLAFNGGPTRTRGLQLGSPAVDRGSNPLALATDQRGNGFPRTVGAATDVGAFEYQPPADCAAFTDVPGSSAFCANVAWIKNRGVTLGCTSPTLYCPGASVIRLAMAAFMNRLGDALSPSTLDAQQVNSPLDLATIPTVCTTGDLAATLYPRRATLDGVFSGVAPGDTFVRLTFRASTDGGATWTNLGFYRALGTLPATAWHSMRGVGYFDVPAGDQVRFSLRIDRGDAGVGPNLVNESTCHLRVRTENSAGFSLL